MRLLGWRALLLLAGCSALARGYTLRCPAPRTRLDALTAPRRPSSMRLVHPRMNLGDRFMRLVKSNVNSLMSNLEDPEKVLTQAVDDMQRDLIKVRQAYAEVSASTKRMEGQLSLAEQEADKWYSRAQLALEKGEDELAREALTRRQQQVEMADGLKEQIESQQGSIASLFESMKELEVIAARAAALKPPSFSAAHVAERFREESGSNPPRPPPPPTPATPPQRTSHPDTSRVVRSR